MLGQSSEYPQNSPQCVCDLIGFGVVLRRIETRLITDLSIDERQLDTVVSDSELTSMLPFWMDRHAFLHDANILKPIYTSIDGSTGDLRLVCDLSSRERVLPDCRQNLSRVFVPEQREELLSIDGLVSRVRTPRPSGFGRSMLV